MKILITGGAGFIGSHLCEKLVKSGNQVICIDNFDPYYDPKIKKANIKDLLGDSRFTLAKFDIRDSKKVTGLFKKHKPEYVIHLAALAGVRSSIERAGEYIDVNIGGTINVMDAARRIGTKNFVLASTSSVYGATDKIPFKEDQLSDRPLAPYPASKKGAEVMVHAYHNMFGMNINVLRLFTAYGPRVRPDMMSFMVIDRIARGKEITLFDNAKMQRDWTYIDDVCSGILTAVRKNLGYEVINIGRGKPVKLLEFIKTIEELVGKRAKLKIIPTPASEPTITYASILKAKRLLNYRPRTSIKQGLEKTWEWYKERKI
jgi:UDP-glucuronate 4-epimerase